MATSPAKAFQTPDQTPDQTTDTAPPAPSQPSSVPRRSTGHTTRPGSTGILLDRAILYLTFALTGLGIALPGVLLPHLAREWHLQDAQLGTLFLCAWGGSSLGALLTRAGLRASIVRGSLAVILACLGIAFAGPRLAIPVMALYGTGLGVTMTSISLLRQRQSQGRSREMVRLNLVWAIGACCCPFLILRVLRHASSRQILCSLAFAFFLPLISSLAFARTDPPGTVASVPAWHPLRTLRQVPLAIVLVVFLSTGVEASAGGWLTTYAGRVNPGLGIAIAAPTLLWTGLLLSRLLWSAVSREIPAQRVIRGSLLLLAASAVLLIAQPDGASILVASLGLGFGLGPCYPMLLAVSLRFEESAGIFFIAGLGSATLPWLTGLVSHARLSLRTGFMVPALGIFLMLFAASRFGFAEDRQAPPHQNMRLP